MKSTTVRQNNTRVVPCNIPFETDSFFKKGFAGDDLCVVSRRFQVSRRVFLVFVRLLISFLPLHGRHSGVFSKERIEINLILKTHLAGNVTDATVVTFQFVLRDGNLDVDDELVYRDGSECAEILTEFITADEEPRGDIRDAQGRADVFHHISDDLGDITRTADMEDVLRQDLVVDVVMVQVAEQIHKQDFLTDGADGGDVDQIENLLQFLRALRGQ